MRSSIHAVVVAVLAVACALPAAAQCDQATLSAIDPGAGDQFGWSICGSRDPIAPPTLIVGAPFEDSAGNNAGAAYVFRESGGRWSAAKLLAVELGAGHQFGYSVSIDGDVLAVGAPFDGGNAGAVYIFRYDLGLDAWLQEQRIAAPNPGDSPQFGVAVAVSGDLLAIGAHLDDTVDTNAGAVHVHRFDGLSWSAEATLTTAGLPEGDPDEFNDRFGGAVGLDGDALLIGAVFDDEIGGNAGAVYAFRFNGMDWTDPPQKIMPISGAASDLAGSAVAVDGDIAVFGAPGRDGGDGAVHVLRFSGGLWAEEQEFLAFVANQAGELGSSVALSGGTIVMGEPFSDVTAINAGLGYQSTWDGLAWPDPEVLSAADGAADDNLGAAVGISGGFILLGASLDDAGGLNAGIGYLISNDPLVGDDCNGNGLPDDCEIENELADDCNDNGVPDACDVLTGDSTDCNDNETPDECELDSLFCTEGCLPDCNGNGVPDACEISIDSTAPGGPFTCILDCAADDNDNGIPDDCEDCNDNGILDETDIADGTSADCNDNGVPDACELDPDCEGICADDENGDGIPDDCQGDCDGDGVFDVDAIEQCDGSLDCIDCNDNGVPDGCDLTDGTSEDCNANETPDECEETPFSTSSGELPLVRRGAVLSFGIPADEVEIAGRDVTLTFTTTTDVNQAAEWMDVEINGVPQGSIFTGASGDCPIIDELILDAGAFNGLVGGGDLEITVIPSSNVDVGQGCDSSEYVQIAISYHFLNPPTDCNGNGTPDFCDIDAGASEDLDGNGIPDECVIDCNQNGVSDFEDIIQGTSTDCNDNEIPDECDAPPFDASSVTFSPIGATSPQSWTLDDPPAAGTDPMLTVVVSADVGGPSESIDLIMDGGLIQTIFALDGSECNASSTAEVAVDAGVYNASIGDGSVTFILQPSPQVDSNSGLCPQTQARMTVHYQPIAADDCNGNGIPDFCDPLTVADVNQDTVVDVDDLVAIILAWGTSDPAADVDASGTVDVDDLVTVITAFGQGC